MVVSTEGNTTGGVLLAATATDMDPDKSAIKATKTAAILRLSTFWNQIVN
jgi:hypothetical protein